MGKKPTPFGKKLELLQIQKGINASELAKMTGIPVSNICQLKRTRRPKPNTLFRLGKALHVKPESLLTEETD